MSISTGKGDRGESGLIGGERVPKNDIRLEAYGTVDELNAVIGIARASSPPEAVDAELGQISAWLFSLGTDLATPGAGLASDKALSLGEARVKELEDWIHREEDSLPRLKRFILPGGTSAAAALHMARTVCRRAERHVVALHRETGEATVAIVFLNRLSDLLFLYARRANFDASVPDVQWRA